MYQTKYMHDYESDWSSTDGGTPPKTYSPPRSSPTRSSPTRSSPTRSSPTRSSPTRSSESTQRLPSLYEPIWLPRVNLCRPKLYVKQTLLKRGKTRLPFLGLFTDAPIRKHDFVGIYRGDFYDEEEEDIPTSAYAMNVSALTIVPQNIDPRMNPLAMVNEPPRGTQANVTIVEWTKAKDALPGKKAGDVLMVAFHACRNITEGEELYYYYGDTYDRRSYGRRPYNVGTGCNLSRSNIPVDQRPGPYLHSLGVQRLPNDTYVVFE